MPIRERTARMDRATLPVGNSPPDRKIPLTPQLPEIRAAAHRKRQSRAVTRLLNRMLPKIGSSQTVTSTLSEEEYNKKVADLVAKMYVVKANFTSTLSAFEANIISSYKSLPAEQRTSATKAKIVSDNMSYVTGLEAQCDAQVKAITDELFRTYESKRKRYFACGRYQQRLCKRKGTEKSVLYQLI